MIRPNLSHLKKKHVTGFIFEKKRGVFFLVILTTLFAILSAIGITYAMIRISEKGNLHLGILIASSCALIITPPISCFYFMMLRQLHQSKVRLNEANKQLEHALSEVKILSGLLPICSKCKKIRDSEGYWKKIESYFEDHSDILFSHGLCEDCMKDLYGGEKWFRKKNGKNFRQDG